MILLFCLICAIPGTISEQQPNKRMYASIGNTVQLFCTANSRIKAAKWRKDDKLLFDDSSGSISGITVKTFNDTSNVLQISYITEDDFGVYTCILQTKQEVIMRNIFLMPFEYTTVISKITQSPVELTTHYLEVELTTDFTEAVELTTDFTEAVDQTGLFSQFNIGLLATVFGVILCASISIGCYLIIRKYRNCQLDKKSDNEDTHSVQIEERIQTIAEVENLDTSDSDDSHYETINESEMVNFPLNEPPTIVEIHQRNKEEPCHDSIDEEENLNQTSTENSQDIQNACEKTLDDISEHLLSSMEKLYEPCVAYAVTELTFDESIESGVNTSQSANQIEGNTGDGHRFPYTLLNVNDMEYLHSYSTLLTTTDAFSTVNSSDSNICLDENNVAFDCQYKGKSNNTGGPVFPKNDNSCDVSTTSDREEGCISVVENNNSEDMNLLHPLTDGNETPSQNSRINNGSGNNFSVTCDDAHSSKDTPHSHLFEIL